MVNAALEEEMKEIHALSIKKAQTPQQWKPSQDSATQAKDAWNSVFKVLWKKNKSMMTMFDPFRGYLQNLQDYFYASFSLISCKTVSVGLRSV